MKRELYPLNDAAFLLGVGRTKMHELATRGDVQRVYIDGKPLITAESIGDYIERLKADTGECDA